ncbi:MAG: hypothetical protein FH756_15815 [Firmicutes bacterium]|nr:hypothetical protein [Bacillota bacterium]
MGLGFVIIGLLFSVILGDWNAAATISGVTAAICLGFSAVFSGALNSGDRNRANLATETDDNRKIRIGWSFKLFLVGIPNLIAVIIYLTKF